MTAEAKQFPELGWQMLGAAVDLAIKVVEANPAELVAIITAARKGGNGTSGEQALLTAMRAIHLGAIAQVEIADAAIAVIAGCSNLASEAALATIGPSAANHN
jgi:hypothetical protein